MVRRLRARQNKIEEMRLGTSWMELVQGWRVSAPDIWNSAQRGTEAQELEQTSKPQVVSKLVSKREERRPERLGVSGRRARERGRASRERQAAESQREREREKARD